MSGNNEIVLVDEDGVEHYFSLYRIIEIEQGVYALLQPEGETESDGGGDDELVILRVEGQLEDGHLVTLDDDEWDEVTRTIDGLGLLDEDIDDDEN